MTPPINITFWTTFYRAGSDPDATYDAALQASDALITRAEALWDWKDLSRGVGFETIRPALADVDINRFTEMESAEAVASLGQHLVESGALSNETVVTPAFLLHLAASDPDAYAVDFPIFDASVWRAYAYLAGRRTGTDRLPAAATTSATKYADFVDFFERTIPDDVGGRSYERALFNFGAYIGTLPTESAAEVQTHLTALERGLDEYRADTGHSLCLTE